ncbi:copper resistance protein CopC [Arthrobacter sp. zg-Y40]|uniref:copper resistance CopC family protein n=1 Tax=unclassified Arthrobacter TaxID=235627 RepID=UPI001D13B381|nr:MULTISPECIES: copper resistance CopC family protein [unclassified Arthrobacter]MCC3275735.1 copper resistance protein CopC [Arthrobacter sp. zg-Y20]MCC3278840.1 copper resistance protein CopC [Arthrobacter sp. zg-Y40]MDK1315892.1 copper resistance protein CopC [Arthrobacter sp. zg.Y20]WIB07734.1 copper resistance protein CopC [Arthrobacter sp. zg-Y20]
MNFARSFLSRSGCAAAAVAALTLFAGLLLTAPPAAAHDELTGSTPVDGAVLPAPPQSVELTFSNVPAAIGSEVRVLDEEGMDWAEGDVRILDNSATQQLRPGAPAGSYTVQWRVVSSDAHPIEGTFAFSVAAGADTGSGSASPTGTAQTNAAGPTGMTQTPVLNQPEEGGSPWLVAVPAVVVLIAVAVLIALVVRRRLRED